MAFEDNAVVTVHHVIAAPIQFAAFAANTSSIAERAAAEPKSSGPVGTDLESRLARDRRRDPGDCPSVFG
jgi:hypothetical protein